MYDIHFEYKIEILSFKSLFSCFHLKLDTQCNTNCMKTDMKISDVAIIADNRLSIAERLRLR